MFLCQPLGYFDNDGEYITYTRDCDGKQGSNAEYPGLCTEFQFDSNAAVVYADPCTEGGTDTGGNAILPIILVGGLVVFVCYGVYNNRRQEKIAVAQSAAQAPVAVMMQPAPAAVMMQQPQVVQVQQVIQPVAIPVDTTGDGQANAMGYDLDGDGKVDAVDFNGDGIIQPNERLAK